MPSEPIENCDGWTLVKTRKLKSLIAFRRAVLKQRRDRAKLSEEMLNWSGTVTPRKPVINED